MPQDVKDDFGVPFASGCLPANGGNNAETALNAMLEKEEKI